MAGECLTSSYVTVLGYLLAIAVVDLWEVRNPQRRKGVPKHEALDLVLNGGKYGLDVGNQQ